MALTWSIPSFLGNPRVNITAIDVSGGIQTLLVGSSAPCHLRASAYAVTATGTTTPLKDLSFRWTLQVSDGLGGWDNMTGNALDAVTMASTGESINVFTDQIGINGVWPLRFAGTYRLILTVTGTNGDGYGDISITETASTSDITIAAWGTNGGVFYASPTGNDTNSGSISAPVLTADKLFSLAPFSSEPCILNFSDGTYTLGTNSSWVGGKWGGSGGGQHSNLLIRAMSGTPGVVTIKCADTFNTNSTMLAISANSSMSGTFNNCMTMNVIFDGNNVAGYSVFGSGGGTAYIQNLAFDNCKFQNNNSSNTSAAEIQIGPGNYGSGSFVRGLSFFNCDATTVAGATRKHACISNGDGTLSGDLDWWSWFGGHVYGCANDTTGRDHDFYTGEGSHHLLACIDFTGLSTNRSYNINHGARTGTTAGITNIDCSIWGNLFASTPYGIDCSGPNNAYTAGRYDNFVVVANAFTNDNSGLYWYAGNLTIRNNAFLFNPNMDSLLNVGDQLSTTQFTNNVGYFNSTTYESIGFNAFNGTITISDNRFVSGTSGHFFSIGANSTLSNMTINYNTWYNDAGTSTFLVNGTDRTFSAWQSVLGFDADGVTTDPGFTDALNGDFTTSTTNTLTLTLNFPANGTLGQALTGTWTLSAAPVNPSTLTLTGTGGTFGSTPAVITNGATQGTFTFTPTVAAATTLTVAGTSGTDLFTSATDSVTTAATTLTITPAAGTLTTGDTLTVTAAFSALFSGTLTQTDLPSWLTAATLPLVITNSTQQTFSLVKSSTDHGSGTMTLAATGSGFAGGTDTLVLTGLMAIVWSSYFSEGTSGQTLLEFQPTVWSSGSNDPITISADLTAYSESESAATVDARVLSFNVDVNADWSVLFPVRRTYGTLGLSDTSLVGIYPFDTPSVGPYVTVNFDDSVTEASVTLANCTGGTDTSGAISFSQAELGVGRGVEHTVEFINTGGQLSVLVDSVEVAGPLAIGDTTATTKTLYFVIRSENDKVEVEDIVVRGTASVAASAGSGVGYTLAQRMRRRRIYEERFRR